MDNALYGRSSDGHEPADLIRRYHTVEPPVINVVRER